MAGRLAQFLHQQFAGSEKALEEALAFLDYSFAAVAEGRSLDDWQSNSLSQRIAPDHPLYLLLTFFSLSPDEVDLLLLAGMAEEHEGFADIFRVLHPQGLPHPTIGLAAQFLCHEKEGHQALRKQLNTGSAVRSGILYLAGEEPFFNRHLLLAEMLWPVLHGLDVWPSGLDPEKGPLYCHGLEGWLAEDQVRKALTMLDAAVAGTILLSSDDEETAFQRGSVLVAEAGILSCRIRLQSEMPVGLDRLIAVHAAARKAVPVLRLSFDQEKPGQPAAPQFDLFPGPVTLCSRDGYGTNVGKRPLITIRCSRPGPDALRRMWQEILPALADEAGVLAARFPVEPWQAGQVAADLEFARSYTEGQVGIKEVSSSIRSRAAIDLESSGVRLIRPEVTWKHLVLSEAKTAQLREGLNRLDQQGKVLDEWRFLEGRRGARGVRMLFAGPSGTGKTLSAEVLASALAVDLLLVDLSRVVSKWIGETEKNLARVFEAAEYSRAVLLFDEADALFGKRTEVSDAHDRYANLETAYLLSRLERFEGLAILSTNLRQNIDAAFIRRLEFIVDFEEPSYEQRLALWKCHLPDKAPLAEDVRLEELASRFHIVGGLIRNAAVAAAFLAASEGSTITQEHFIRAVRREYEKSGKPFRELAVRR